MAIVKMNKLSVIGMNAEKDALLQGLMDLGVVELKNGADKLQDEAWRKLVDKDTDEHTSAEFDKKAQSADNALSVLKQYADIKKPLFAVRRVITSKQKEELDAKMEIFEQEISEVNELQNKLSEAFTKENTANSTIASLTPWASYDAPLELKETKRTGVRLGVFPPKTDVDGIIEQLTNEGCAFELVKLNEDNEQLYASLCYIKDDEEKVFEIIKSHGYSNAGIDGFSGTIADNIAASEQVLAEVATEKQQLIDDIASKADYKNDIEYYFDMMSVARDQRSIKNQLLKTKETYTFDGWVPAQSEREIADLLGKYTCWYEFTEPAEDEETPVKMQNNKVVSPLEFITKMYALPDSKEIDPTAIFSLFYVVFFGIMFADIGYGIILFLLTLFVIKKYHLTEGGVSDLMKLLNYCGISSAFWGLMFGSFFGDLITVIGKVFFGTDSWGIKPVWLNPVDKAMTLLVFSCALGVLHLFVGMGIDAYKKIKAGRAMEAVNDDFVWYLIVLGIVMWLFGGRVNPAMPGIGKIMTLAGFAAAIIIPIFINKGVGKALGFWSIYSGVTGNLSDILSYSRLLGLGLASASIAQVFNFLAQMLNSSKSVVGAICFILVVIIGHVFNFAINALGSFVHAARLQYVEFFGKFFDGGGEPFKPFEKDTKYVRIIEEGK